MSESIRVLLVDDQVLLRHSLRIILDNAPGIDVVGEAANGREAVTAARMLAPDVVLMDIRMPDVDGIEATRQIMADAHPSARVLILTMFELDEYVYAALQAGASGFLLKDARPQQLLDAIARTHDGESLFAPSVLATLVRHFIATTPGGGATGIDLLTPRENEVLALVGHGRSNDEIADSLTLSVKTVKTHIGNLLSKLHARDRAQLVISAYENGLVSAGYRMLLVNAGRRRASNARGSAARSLSRE